MSLKRPLQLIVVAENANYLVHASASIDIASYIAKAETPLGKTKAVFYHREYPRYCVDKRKRESPDNQITTCTVGAYDGTRNRNPRA
jgi:hypothetical protein